MPEDIATSTGITAPARRSALDKERARSHLPVSGCSDAGRRDGVRDSPVLLWVSWHHDRMDPRKEWPKRREHGTIPVPLHARDTQERMDGRCRRHEGPHGPHRIIVGEATTLRKNAARLQRRTVPGCRMRPTFELLLLGLEGQREGHPLDMAHMQERH